MIAWKVNKAAAPRQVPCKTLDNAQTSVDLDVLLASRTFKKMYDDLGLQEHDEFPGIFPVMTVSSRVFNKVIQWCKEHKDEPEPIVEKDPLTQECKWFTFSEYDYSFCEVPMLGLLELVMAANFLDIPRLYHYACQSVAAGIKGKRPREICELLRQECDLDDAHTRKALDDNPWLECPGRFPSTPAENAIFIPNEVLVTIFAKLPREDLERLQLVSTQFYGVIVSSVKLSQHQGPLRVVAGLEFVDRRPTIYMWLRYGRRITCPNYEDLAKRLKFAIVQKLCVTYGVEYYDDKQFYPDVQDSLIPAKSAWRNATVEIDGHCFPSEALFEFAFTHLFLCKEIVLRLADLPSRCLRSCMRLPAMAACGKLDVSWITARGIQSTDVVQWLEHEAPPEETWSEPRQMILHERALIDSIDDLLIALKTAFLTASSPKPYAVRIRQYRNLSRDRYEVLLNEKTHEQLIIETLSSRCGQNQKVLVERA